MQTIQDSTIDGETVNIDEKQFIRCTLTNCVLNYSGGSLAFEGCHFRNCRYMFFGPARGTVHFLEAVGLLAGEKNEWGEYPETVH